MRSQRRKFSISTSTPFLYIPKQLSQHHHPFIQPSQHQHHHHHRRLLESKLITALDNCSTRSHAQQIHAQILLNNLHQSSYLLTKLIRTLTKLNIPSNPYLRSIFLRVENPNPFLYTALIRAYITQSQLPQSVQIYALMRKNYISPVSFTFTAFFKACGELFDVNLGSQMHAQTILIGGFSSDLYVCNALINMYVKCGVLECARKVFDDMPVRDLISWTELIVSYAKTGDMGSAGVLFDELPVKDKVAWTAMITGFAQNARPREAIEWFERMMEAGVEVDEVSLIGAVSGCAQLGAGKYADWVRDVAEKCGFRVVQSDVVVGSAFVDMYSKCGNVEEAYRIFVGMKERNVFSYSSMIMGFAVHGRALDAIELFDEMVKTDVKPNAITFIWVLTGCGHAGLVEQGWRLFNPMKKDYGVEPSADHYTCMVDLLGRAGRLEEAVELVESMPMEPHCGVWGALLGASRVHKDPDVAEIAAGHLFELEPHNIGNYILLSNIYASAGRWHDASRIRKLMRMKGLKKNPGCSWLESEKGVIHEFFAGDMTHPKSSEIKQAMEDLLDRLEANGYQPNLNSVPYDVSDEEKRRILLNHSEKLALAFGLISLDPGCTIRIVKNLRICEDCHSVMCAASQVLGREIVMRDKMRFHHFRDGACSCANFW